LRLSVPRSRRVSEYRIDQDREPVGNGDLFGEAEHDHLHAASGPHPIQSKWAFELREKDGCAHDRPGDELRKKRDE